MVYSMAGFCFLPGQASDENQGFIPKANYPVLCLFGAFCAFELCHHGLISKFARLKTKQDLIS